MKISGKTVLITGGATGIGLALAEEFLKRHNTVLICGRREKALAAAGKRHPDLHTFRCDVADPDARLALHRWATGEFPGLSILVNNAGIQRQLDFRRGVEELDSQESEIRINLEAPVHLSALFLPHLLSREEAAVINVSSGLAFVPLAIMPVYCATKAAMHSFSLSLRHQLGRTAVKVFEVIPPTTDTELDRGARSARSQRDRGIPPAEVAATVMAGMDRDEYEIAVGAAKGLVAASRSSFEQVFERMNGGW
jgi:uncharacterized oxidoreductase